MEHQAVHDAPPSRDCTSTLGHEYDTVLLVGVAGVPAGMAVVDGGGADVACEPGVDALRVGAAVAGVDGVVVVVVVVDKSCNCTFNNDTFV